MPFIVYVKKRPGVDFFINEMFKYFELAIYTASLVEVNLKKIKLIKSAI